VDAAAAVAVDPVGLESGTRYLVVQDLAVGDAADAGAVVGAAAVVGVVAAAAGILAGHRTSLDPPHHSAAYPTSHSPCHSHLYPRIGMALEMLSHDTYIHDQCIE